MTKKPTSRPQLEVLEDRTTPSAWVAFDFNGHGLWRWSDDNGFQQVGMNDNSSHLAINENGDIAVSYGTGLSGTLWRVTGGNGWQQFGTAAPNSLAIADNDWMAASFVFPIIPPSIPSSGGAGTILPPLLGLVSGGVWRITPQLTWQKISDQSATLKDLIATQVGVTQDGTVIANFGANGLWRFTDANGWQELTTANATVISVSDNGWIVGSFGSLGVWRISDSQGWQLLTNQAEPTQLSIEDDGDVAGDFGTHGLWRIRDSDGWQQLTSATPAQNGIGISSDNENTYADFTGKGVYSFDTSDNGNFTQLVPLDPNHLAVA
jgi:hypothetical protein